MVLLMLEDFNFKLVHTLVWFRYKITRIFVSMSMY